MRSTRSPERTRRDAGREPPHACEVARVLADLEVVPERGLSTRAARSRLVEYGPNQLRQKAPRRALAILVDQLRGLMVWFLSAAAALAFAFGDAVEAFAISVVVVINALIGFFTELQATRSMEALRRLGTAQTNVRRDGHVRSVPAESLVPGDVVLLEGGDVVTADLRVIAAARPQVNEAALTGESLPVQKQPGPLVADTPLVERSNMLYKGTLFEHGSAEAVVVATGLATELGRISALVEATVDERTPLERRLDRLSRRLLGLTLVVAASVALSGLLGGRPWLLMVETGIALAVATIPEGLPVVATLALARGMWRMAARHALVNRLAAVETLGATRVICTDKTGTLTENRMRVAEAWCDGRWQALERGFEGPDAEAALRIATLCNNANLHDAASGEGVGDPTELALLAFASHFGCDRAALQKRWPELREEAFDPATRRMATLHATEQGCYVAVKGAPEAVLEVCTRQRVGGEARPLDAAGRRALAAAAEELGSRGLRVLALAEGHAPAATANPYRELTFTALVGFLDPPRRDVVAALAQCREAGIQVVMVTGDQASTALEVARRIGLAGPEARLEALPGSALEARAPDRARLLAATVFARVSPEQKLRLIDLHRGADRVVAMTGDGVNDAPALKKADIGIAMGRRGTQVAREAADIVLEDDAFPTIVEAVRQGRAIFNNIRRFVVYLMSCNLAEVLAIGVATAFGSQLPILPLQILFLNLVTDVFPALALGFGRGDPALMGAPPRPASEPLITPSHWHAIAAYGALLTAAVLGAFALALARHPSEPERAVTVSFLTLALGQVWHVFNMRDPGSSRLANDVVQSPWVWGAVALCLGLLLAALVVPALADVLQLTWPEPGDWLVVVGASLAPLAIGQLWPGRRPAILATRGEPLATPPPRL